MPIPKLVITAALMAVQIGLQMSQRIKGPRLDELKVSVSDYGTPLPRFWGIRRFECPIDWAEDLREEKNTSKTKGGKYDEYKYYGTFRVIVADQEIDDVTRIWMDRRLVYDVTKEGPISAASLFRPAGSTGPIKLSSGENMRIYLGTEDQEVDPRYQAWCEDRYGADSAPALRGVANIVFEDIPLELFGNRIPQVTVEAVSVKTNTYPYESRTTRQEWEKTFCFSPDYSRFATAHGGVVEVFDTAKRTAIVSAPSAWPMNEGLTMDSSGKIWGPYDGWLWSSGADGIGGSAVHELAQLADRATALDETVYAHWSLGGNRYMVGAAEFALPFAPSMVFKDTEGNHWFVGFIGANIGMECVHGARIGETASFASPTGSGGPVAACDNGAEFVFSIAGGNALLWKVDRTTLAITDTGAATGTTTYIRSWQMLQPGSKTVWNSSSEVSLETLGVVRNTSGTGWPAIGFTIYDPVCNALIAQPVAIGDSATIYHLFLDRIGSNGVPLQAIVDSVCGWCGLTDKDTSALTQTVLGYSVTQGSGKDMIDPLLSIHDVDARPHDFTLQFFNRGSAPLGTLLTEDFVREGGSSRYGVRIRQDTDLPKKITVLFADVNADQQTNSAAFQRPLDAVDSQREERVDLSTFVTNADTAQQLIDRFGRREWNSREEITNALTAQHLALEPGDVKPVSLDGKVRNAKLNKLAIARSGRGERLECEWIRDEVSFAALNTTTTGSEMDGHDEESIVIPAPTRGFVLDAPLATDADNDVNPLLYTAAGPYAQMAFSGAAIYRGDDGTYDDLFETVSTAATWGGCLEALADVNSPWLWDRGNSLNVSLQNGSLSTVTEAAIDADPSLNLILIGSVVNGWEYLNFTTATLEGDGTYTLSGFKRGRRGTERMTGAHTAGEAWILASTIANEELGTDDVGDALSFKAQSIGRPLDSAPAMDLTFTGATLKPYAPTAFRAEHDSATGDWSFTWTRRTRVGGAWIGGTTIPLAENSEAYELVLPTSAGTRTIAATSASATWTSAQQTEDYGSAQASLPAGIAVYQLSDSVGRGFASAQPVAA